jgi:hypothetical protein
MVDSPTGMCWAEGKSDMWYAVNITQMTSSIVDDTYFNIFMMKFMYNDMHILDQSLLDRHVSHQ